MKIVEEKKGKITVFSLEGRLDSNTCSDVEKRILDSINSGVKAIILDFSALDYISSAGIRILVHCHKELEKQGGNIILSGIPKPIENVLYITGFLPYFKIYERKGQAIASIEQLND